MCRIKSKDVTKAQRRISDSKFDLLLLFTEGIMSLCRVKVDCRV